MKKQTERNEDELLRYWCKLTDELTAKVIDSKGRDLFLVIGEIIKRR